jgi:hypothetical protein
MRQLLHTDAPVAWHRLNSLKPISKYFFTEGALPTRPPEMAGLRPPRFMLDFSYESDSEEAEGRLLQGAWGAEPPSKNENPKVRPSSGHLTELQMDAPVAWHRLDGLTPSSKLFFAEGGLCPPDRPKWPASGLPDACRVSYTNRIVRGPKADYFRGPGVPSPLAKMRV